MMNNGPDDLWIARMVIDERESLCYEVGNLIKRIAGATPFPGDIGDEYDKARTALRTLHDRLLREVG